MSKNDVAGTIGFTISPPQKAIVIGSTTVATNKMLKDVTVDISKNTVVDDNGFNNIGFVDVVEPLVLATICSTMLSNQWFYQLFGDGNDDEDHGN